MAATVMATLMLGVAGAGAAQFKADTYTANITGEQLGTGTGGGGGESGTILSFEGQMTECGSAGFAGELKAASTQLSVGQIGVGCTAFGFMTAHLATNGCTYRLNIGSGSVDNYSGTVDIVCPAEAKMVLTSESCEIQIGSQNGLSTVSYENLTKESPKKLRVVFNVSGFTYTKTKDGLLCPLNGTGVATDGKLVGSTKVFATSGGTATGLRIE
ncbi:MAG: hypothetical protein E6G51_06685 [Actinobacteria bacterium]|nr:MAG: hypothetical protein E6G51_06685 [Actinomycetota bacterium]